MRSCMFVAALSCAVVLANRNSWAAKPAPSNAAGAAAPATSEKTEKLIQDALRAEAEGHFARRERLLEQAVQSDPSHPAAHWHRSELLLNGKWLAIDDAAKQFAKDGRIFEYNNRRSSSGGSAAEQFGLAQWCGAAGLPEQQRFHALQAIAADPSMAQARAAIGLRSASGRWLTPSEVAEQTRRNDRSQKDADQWNKQLSSWLRDIKKSANAETREAARLQVRRLNEPSAIPALEQVFSVNSEPTALLAVQAVSNMPQQAGTESLLRHAVLSPWEVVRQAAAESLKQRSLYSYAPLLLSGLAAPIEAQFGFVEERPGSWRYRCMLFREGPMADTAMELQVTVRPDWAPQTGSAQDLADARSGTVLPTSAEGLNATQAINAREFGVNEAGIQEANQRVAALNERIINVLKVTTGAGEKTAKDAEPAKNAQPNKSATKSKSQKSKRNSRSSEPVPEPTNLAAADDKQPRYWWKWWYDHNDIYYTEERPTQNTFYQYQASYQPTTYLPPRQSQPTDLSQFMPSSTLRSSECFIAGTPVWTPTGAMGIELVQPGDLVLAQHPETGELAYKVVLATTSRPPTQLLRLQLEQGELIVTRGHPLWVSGKGWRMARELAVGDLLHTAGGTVRVQQIEPAAKAQAYNLVVDTFNTYFAGPDRVLAHDNELRQPTDTVVPGLATR